MPPIIDADTHIIEHPGVFELMDPEWYPRRPVQVTVPADSQYGRANAAWLVDGVLTPRLVGKGSVFFAVPASETERGRTDIPQRIRSLTDVAARVAALDARGVDVEVIFPTMFLGHVTADPDLEAALTRSYNRFMAGVWEQGRGRLRWVVVPPLHNVPEAVQAIHDGRAKGAAGVFFRGVEDDRTLVEPYFYPVYEAAREAGLPICVHTGAGSPAISSVFDRHLNHNLPQNRALPLFAFRDIVAHRLPDRFPGLRFGFIEASSSWVPYVLHHLRRSGIIDKRGERPGVEDMWEWGPQLFRDLGLYVACEVDEDLPYVLRYVGEDNLICGSDYGHQDQSRETGMVAVLRSRADLPPGAAERILSANAARFYGFD